MASKSTKLKTATSRAATPVLSANLSNSSFDYLPATGLKGKSPASSSRNVNVQPDLDLIGGFAFLSFASLAQLEAHIEHNEAKFAAVSVDVGQKRKAGYPGKQEGSSSEVDGPPSKKKPKASKKKPTKKNPGASTSNLAVNPREASLPSKKETRLVDSVFDLGELSSSFGQTGVCGSVDRTLEHSPNSELEISLLCSETVPDLGDDEEIPAQQDLGSKVLANSEKQAAGHGSADNSSIQVNDNIGEVASDMADQKPKKKKKKKKSEHCDQTSQTKFRIKKKNKLSSQNQSSVVGSSSVTVDQLKDGTPLDVNIQEMGNNKGQTKPSSAKSVIEKTSCARTTAYQGANKNFTVKSRTFEIGSASSTSREVIVGRSFDRVSADVCTPNSSDREIDVDICDLETRSNSMLSDISDHSSDIETFDPNRCFLLNNKTVKIEKEDFEEEGGIVDVDIETVSKEVKKNFLVVSGIELGHFSYHPAETKEGTIDTSIQAYSNEIDIFLQCAKMQEGQIIKIIHPDDSLELPSPGTLKNQGRDPDVVKATRSATERRRRHHLGDLFQDMKMEVFTDLMDSDNNFMYFSKQAILSKAISTLEELVQGKTDLSKTKEQLLQQNKELKEKRNMLMFGKSSVDVDDVKVEAILNQLNIKVEPSAKNVEVSENKTSQELEEANVKPGADSKNTTTVEPSVRGRPKKNVLPPWLLKPALKPNDDTGKATTNVANRANPQTRLETPKVTTTSTVLSQEPSSVKTSNVSCGVQTHGEETALPKADNPTLSEIMLLSGSKVKGKATHESTCQVASEPSQAENSPKVIHTITSLTQTAPATKISAACSQSQDKEKSVEAHSSALKNTGIDQPSSQDGAAKPGLVKILPKPAIFQLNPNQQKAIMESLGQIKQPSSDKIICNLSRLSTQTNTSAPSRICIIRSSQLMKSLDSKDVMHLKITNDPVRNLNTGSSNVNATSTVSNMPNVNSPPNVLVMSASQRPALVTSKPHLTVSSTQPVLSEIKTVPGVLLLKSIPKPEAPVSTVHLAQKYPEKPALACVTSSQTVSSGQNILLLKSTQKSVAPSPMAQMQQMVHGRTLLTPTTINQSVMLGTKTAANVLSVSSTQPPGVMTSTVQIPQTQCAKTVLTTVVPSQPFLSEKNTVPNVKVPTSAIYVAQKQPEKTTPVYGTSNQSVSSSMQTELLPLLLTGNKKPETPTFTATAVQQDHKNTVLGPAVANQPVSSSFIRIMPSHISMGNTNKNLEVGTPGAQMPQSHSKRTMLVSQVPLKSPVTTSSPKMVVGGQQINLLTAGSTEMPSSTGSASADDVTLRALASLNQFQVNKPAPPLTDAVSNPLFPNKNPGAGYLTGLKNVVMNVDAGGAKIHPTSSVYTIPIVTVTSSFKTATTSKVAVSSSSHKSLEEHSVMPTVCSTPLVFIPTSISLNSCFTSSSCMSSGKGTVSTLHSTGPGSAVISVPTSTSLKSSFTMSALNTPIPTASISADRHLGAMPLVTNSLDPFNLVPKQLPLSKPAIPSELKTITSSLNIGTEVPIQVNECDTSLSPLLIADELFKPETSNSSTVLTQEMLNIPGIKQNADLSSVLLDPSELPIPDILPNLDEMDQTIDSVKVTTPSRIVNKPNTSGSNTSSSGRQADASLYSLRSSSTNANKQTSPLKVAIKDFRKGRTYF